MKTSWHGLSIEYRVIPCGGGPGLRPDFETEIESVTLEDRAEFDEHHPGRSPSDILQECSDEIDRYLDKEVRDGGDD